LKRNPPPRRSTRAPQLGRSNTSRGPHKREAAGTAEGIVSPHRSGFGFVRVPGQEANVFLPPSQMVGLTAGDRVRVEIAKDREGRFAGTVIAILSRGVTSFLGSIELSGRTAYVNSVDRRLGLRFIIAAADLGDARHGDWVIAAITSYPDGSRPGSARVQRRVDPDKPLELAVESAIARYGLPTAFPDDTSRAAEGFGSRIDAREAQRRVDLRAMPLVTIDGEDARDFDDAVYAEEHERGFRLVVAIADVSHYVRPGSPLDREARERGTSVYFPNRVLPMLPTALSDRLCSLEPDVDRLCFAADMVVSRTGTLVAARFYPAVMRSHARLTYNLAHAALFAREPAAVRQVGPVAAKLEVLVSLYLVLLRARHKRGALDFDSSEAAFEFDGAERVRAITFKPRNDAHKLVEECMILANVAAAGALRRARAGGLYRVHAVPDAKKLDALTTTLASLGIAAQLPEEVTPQDLRRITERIGERADRPFLESLVVRSLPQALYQPLNIGHFGLALKEYAHFTSPIRRYPDLVVHRALKAIVDPQDPTGVRAGAADLTEWGAELSRLEKRADEADRYVDTFLKCTFLRERLGQSFEGLVTTVVEFGCFIQLVDLAVDGLLHIDSMRGETFEMEDGGRAWRGGGTGLRLAPGTRLRVIVTSANPVEGLIDLELAP
jgi:ribonuclease R